MFVNVSNNCVRALLGFDEDFGEVNANYAETENRDATQQPDGNNQRRPTFKQHSEKKPANDHVSRRKTREDHYQRAQVEDKNERLVAERRYRIHEV